MELSGYLKRKHLEYINEIGDVVSTADWVKNELNPRLAPGDKIAMASFNQWISEDRRPDGRNIIRLVNVFDFEILPYLGMRSRSTLAPIAEGWESLTPEKQQQMNQLYMELQGLEPAPAALQT